MDGASAVPLFLPSNHKWNQLTRQVEINTRKPRGNIKVCEEGLHLIRSIQKEFIVVVCITGPARTGKSYFLSQMQNGIHFELGHSTTSKTTGVWIALSPRPIEVDGKRARLVLMDAEGLGSASTVDHGQNDKWENRVFSLCALLSSYLIYNSRGIPNSDDLDKLGFIAQFSSAIHSGSRSAERDGPAPATGHFRQVAPHFLWLVRDALLIPEINGVPCDWKTYVEKEVLSVKDGKAECRRSSVCRAITETFQSFNAFGLPPPSVDPNVIQNLSLPKTREKINPTFISGIQEVKAIISSNYCLKSIYGCPVTGLQMAESLSAIVAAVNKECDKLPIDSMWDVVVKSQLNKNVEQAVEAYNQNMVHVRLPAPTHYIKTAHDKAVKKARTLFHQLSRNFDQDVCCKYVDKLAKRFEKSFMDMTEANEKESRSLCEKAMKDLFEQYLSPLEEDVEDRTFTDILRAKQNIFKIYSKRAKGPLAGDVRKEAEERLQGKMKNLGQIILQTATRQVKDIYKDEMKATENDVPLEEAQLDDIHRKAFKKCQDILKTKCCGYNDFKKGKKDIESDMRTVFQSYRKSNYALSKEFCQQLMENLECRHLETVFMILNRCKYSDLLTAKENLFAEFDVEAKGPAKVSVRKKWERKINHRLRLAQKTVVDASLSDAKREYVSLLEDISHQGPYDIEDLQRRFDEEFDKMMSVLHVRCKGVEELLFQTFGESLNDVKKEQNRKYMRRNDERSREVCQELMKKLISQHLTPKLKNVSPSVNFKETRERIMHEYEKEAKGPRKGEVKNEYETQIDEDIKRGEQYRVLKGVKITLEATYLMGAAMSPFGGNVGRVGATISAAASTAAKIVKEEFPK
ncbi:Guanylate-binding protein 2 [Holothuria leucospilota]|uniref:Guanylate-binding protein 2 n=1 Tax=Holothuria leucospilota TaxID=206669 RepID=A0A9Q1C4E6_HOLLE|nr:Guanylate-binding protein 2 [Holothuria leucospilota]